MELPKLVRLVSLFLFLFLSSAAAFRSDTIFASSSDASTEILDIAWTTDAFYFEGTLASMRAVMMTQSPAGHLRFRFWIIAESEAAQAFSSLWSAQNAEHESYLVNFTEVLSAASQHPSTCKRWSPARSSSDVNVIAFVPTQEQFAALSRLHHMPGGQRSLKKLSNIIRNWMPDFLLPFGVDKVLYLDSDAFVQVSLFPLVNERPPRALGVIRDRVGVWGNYAHPFITQRHQTPPLAFNAGVMLFQLERFCALDIPKTIAHLHDLQATDGIWQHNSCLVHQMTLILAVPSQEVHFFGDKWNERSEGAFIRHQTGNYRAAHLNHSVDRLEELVRDWPRSAAVLDELAATNSCLDQMRPKRRPGPRNFTMPWRAVHNMMPDTSDMPSRLLTGHKYVECTVEERWRTQSFDRARILANWGDPDGLHGEHSLLITTVVHPYDRLFNLYSRHPHRLCNVHQDISIRNCKKSFLSFLQTVERTNYGSGNPDFLPIASLCHMDVLSYDLIFKIEHLDEQNRCFAAAFWNGAEWKQKSGLQFEPSPREPEALSLIQKLYSIDFELTGYELTNE